jgi:hypothetical protein
MCFLLVSIQGGQRRINIIVFASANVRHLRWRAISSRQCRNGHCPISRALAGKKDNPSVGPCKRKSIPPSPCLRSCSSPGNGIRDILQIRVRLISVRLQSKCEVPALQVGVNAFSYKTQFSYKNVIHSLNPKVFLCSLQVTNTKPNTTYHSIGKSSYT